MKSRDYAKKLFIHNHRSDFRVEGAVLVLITDWIGKGGLDDLIQVAESISWESLHNKNYIGDFVLQHCNYVLHLIEYLKKDPFSHGMMELISHNSQFKSMLKRYVAEFIKIELKEWFDANDERISNERHKFKQVQKVLES